MLVAMFVSILVPMPAVVSAVVTCVSFLMPAVVFLEIPVVLSTNVPVAVFFGVSAVVLAVASVAVLVAVPVDVPVAVPADLLKMLALGVCFVGVLERFPFGGVR